MVAAGKVGWLGLAATRLARIAGRDGLGLGVDGPLPLLRSMVRSSAAKVAWCAGRPGDLDLAHGRLGNSVLSSASRC